MSQEKNKMPRKRMLSFMLALCMMLTTLPAIPLWAAEDQTESANVTMSEDADNAVDENTDETEAASEIAEEASIVPEEDNISDNSEKSDAIENNQNTTIAFTDKADDYEGTATDGICGDKGDNLLWDFKNGTLTIRGKGKMADYGSYSIEGNDEGDSSYGYMARFGDAPWWNLRGEINKIVIGEGVTNIGFAAFYKTNVVNIEISNSVTSIEGGAFARCRKLLKATLPKNLVNIGLCSFERCTSLTNVVLPNSLNSIGIKAFSYCESLEKVDIPGGVTKLGWRIFEGCNNLTSVIIQNGLCKIGTDMFDGCANLSSIVIPKSVIRIGRGAFNGCGKLTSIYYEGHANDWREIDTEGNDYSPIWEATKFYNYVLTGGQDDPECQPTITPNPTSVPQKSYKIYTNEDVSPPNGYEEFDCSLEECMNKTASVEYNPQLAHMLIAMCNSVHDKEKMEKTFDDFGFNKDDYMTDYNLDKVLLAYGFAKKQLNDGTTLVLIVGRGTVDEAEEQDNLNVGPNEKNQHTGFSDTAHSLYDQLVAFLGTEDFSNMQFVITGHSRGGAVANLLAARMQDDRVAQNKFYPIYTYTFASPDVVKTDEKKAHVYSSIFNIGNANDYVTWLPESAVIKGWGWEKFGNSCWYAEDWNDYKNFCQKLTFDFEERTNAYHLQGLYLGYLRSENLISVYKSRSETTRIINKALEDRKQNKPASNRGGRVIKIHCPVDVSVYASNKALVGRVTNNVAENIDISKSYIFVEGDKKYIYLLDIDDYTIKLTGTDDGTMMYSVQNLEPEPNGTFKEKVFENVALTNGKEMTSQVSVWDDNDENIKDEDRIDVQDVKLLVLDNKKNIKMEVLSDGKEVPLKAANTKIKKLKITGSSKKVAVGKKLKLKVAVSPANATNKAITWKSSNTKYATVNSKGIVTIKKAAGGKTVTIIATAKDGSGIKASYKIQCMKGVVKKIAISDKKTRTIKAGKSIKLKAKVNATKGANKTLRWSSSNTRYAKVNNRGKVITKKAGKGKTIRITVTATDGSGKKATVRIKLK